MIEDDQGSAQGISDGFQKFYSDRFDLSSKEKECKNFGPQKDGDGDGCSNFLQQLPGSLPGVQSYEGFAKNIGGDADAPVHSMTHEDGFAEGKDLVVPVMSAMGEEQICALKDIGPK
ncbi:hypothetical protein E1A91_D04G175100v1 [Gossypium mustelinum]|uniref:Translation initiation factor 5A C-terminal domain-containing protein n=1 Tax=Gossypium mustelinum TaxID=34275 RepID=A0A5D2VF31_GOSMU|nr:hypothetical protein E1A91_D04G175100v1 [Gossypium mustelinum]